MEHEPCKFEDKIIKMAENISVITNDVKWMKADTIRRNGIMEEHVAESDRFRRAVDRNIVWRHVYKVICTVLAGGIGFCVWTLFYHLNKMTGR